MATTRCAQRRNAAAKEITRNIRNSLIWPFNIPFYYRKRRLKDYYYSCRATFANYEFLISVITLSLKFPSSAGEIIFMFNIHRV